MSTDVKQKSCNKLVLGILEMLHNFVADSYLALTIKNKVKKNLVGAE